MNGLRMVALGSGVGTSGAGSPDAVLQAGWTLVEAPAGLPDARWLRQQQVDLVVVYGDPHPPAGAGAAGGPAQPQQADPWRAILSAARSAGCGVVWVTDRAAPGYAGGKGEGARGTRGQDAEDMPGRLAACRWPHWACLAPDAPAWLWVAVCRTVAEAARRETDLRRRVERLSTQLEDRKVIERAKGILMDRFDLTESEAYRRMRDTAMRQRKSLREIAQAVVAFDEGR